MGGRLIRWNPAKDFLAYERDMAREAFWRAWKHFVAEAVGFVIGLLTGGAFGGWLITIVGGLAGLGIVYFYFLATQPWIAYRSAQKSEAEAKRIKGLRERFESAISDMIDDLDGLHIPIVIATPEEGRSADDAIGKIEERAIKVLRRAQANGVINASLPLSPMGPVNAGGIEPHIRFVWKGLAEYVSSEWMGEAAEYRDIGELVINEDGAEVLKTPQDGWQAVCRHTKDVLKTILRNGLVGES